MIQNDQSVSLAISHAIST